MEGFPSILNPTGMSQAFERFPSGFFRGATGGLADGESSPPQRQKTSFSFLLPSPFSCTFPSHPRGPQPKGKGGPYSLRNSHNLSVLINFVFENQDPQVTPV
ncbi:hypothetical protein MHYP_G00199510 [Metynnis hypsauchen]